MATPASPPAVSSPAAVAITRAAENTEAARGDTWSRRLLGRFHITGTFWVRAIMWVSRGSEFRATTMVWLWSTVFFFLLRRPRRIVTRHLDHILGRAGFFTRQRRIFRFFKEHAWSLVERFEQFRPDFKPRVDRDGPGWPDLLADQKGFLIVTGHIGMWEIGQLMPVTDGVRKLHVVREREEHEGTQQVVAELLQDHPHAKLVTHFLDDDMALGASLLGALRKGDVVCLAADRAKAGMVAVGATCFGHPVQMPVGPVALARAADVLVVPVFVYRVGRRHYRAVACQAFKVGRSDDRQRDHLEAVQRLAAEVETAIRRDPFQWKRWEPLW
ncbi:MAG: lysophospholipid acyltransferase family protein [Planctomycetes bacterium]|nr:lysophospholipid acyltransferase family protein [Planctomycetota bacterium]